MNARDAAVRAASRLAQAGVADPNFEAELLTRESAQVSRSEYFAGAPITPADAAVLDGFVDRRVQREPAAYITGHREFYGRDFAVGPGVLIPRPETELLVELALGELDEHPSARILEVGTGSGAVAVSVAAERPGTSVFATEISRDAMRFAKLNAERHDAGVRLVRGDLAAAVGQADVVLANLPYIPTWEIEALEPEVSKYEPLVALDGGVDGFTLIRRLIEDCARRLRPALLALEVAYGQAPEVERIIKDYGADAWSVKDLSGIDRIVCSRWK